MGRRTSYEKTIEYSVSSSTYDLKMMWQVTKYNETRNYFNSTVEAEALLH
jgi:hypothetical protein